jgi:phosphopantothenoylcysteine synthetase/decarboxylase
MLPNLPGRRYDVAVIPVLYVVGCGGYPAAHLGAFIDRLPAGDWDVCVIATPSGLRFMDSAALQAQTGHVVRSEYKQPDAPDVLPPADAMAVLPATFNTTNKMAQGISDTLALGLLNEAIGRGLPILAVPNPNAALARHPAFAASVAALRSWGVRVLFDPETYPLPTPNMGPPSGTIFPWDAVHAAVGEMRSQLAGARAAGGDSAPGRGSLTGT